MHLINAFTKIFLNRSMGTRVDSSLVIDTLLEPFCVIEQGRDGIPTEYAPFECIDSLIKVRRHRFFFLDVTCNRLTLKAESWLVNFTKTFGAAPCRSI
jgi:hypothetical protein